MKPLNETELRELVQWMKPRVEGARLQDVGADADGLWLEIYRHGVGRIYFDLKPGRGFMVLWPGDGPRARKAPAKPLGLFLNAHAKNLELRELRLKEGFGRVVELLFTSQDGAKTCRLTAVLIPQALNLIAEAGEKRLSWEKPKPLEPQAGTGEFPVRYTDWEDYLRDHAELRRGGGPGRGGPSVPAGGAAAGPMVPRATESEAGPMVSPAPEPESGHGPAPAPAPEDARVPQWRKDLQKKRGVIAKLDEALAGLDPEPWRELGEALKFGRALPEHPLWDAKLSLGDNRERAFRKAKDMKQKIEGNRARRAELVQETARLEEWIRDPARGPAPRPDGGKGRGTKALQKTEAKGRTLNLASGLQAVYGRSAKDNLAILRQARAWDLWLHLKDEPGAHAIIFREKNANVTHADIEEVAQRLYRESHGKKTRVAGLRFEVIVVECRFVRPIKGDQLGRVNYHSPTVYSFASKD